MAFFTEFSESHILRWIKDNKRLKTNSEIPASYICSKCKELLIDPIQTDCGCRYCLHCFQEYFDAGNRTCLNQAECDNTSLSDTTTVDKAATRDILRMSIKCPFIDCEFLAELKNIKTHMMECEHQEERCDLCDSFYSQKEKENHVNLFCAKREVSCRYCDSKMQHYVLLNEHYEVDSPGLCHKYVAECPHGCGLYLLYEHKKDCPKKPMKCPFPECREQCTKATINEHLTEENYKHLSTFLETTLSRDDDIGKLEKEIKVKIERIDELEKAYKELIDETRLKLQQANKTVSRTLAPSVRKTIFRKGTMVWKIENIMQLKSNAENNINVSKLSDPFYSSEFGYKLCIKVYPAGDGIGHRNYFSIYFVVMKGEYDEILSWPFKNKVMLSILAPNKNVTETFKPDPASACYQRPTEECNIASGSPKFVKFDELPRLIIDGNIFIKMAVLPN